MEATNCHPGSNQPLAQPFLHYTGIKQRNNCFKKEKLFQKEKAGLFLFCMITNGFNRHPYHIYKWQGQNWEVSYYKSRSKKNRANNNKMNFPTINESIVLKENSAA